MMVRPLVMVWMLVAAAACTVPNPRLCQNIPDCGTGYDQGTGPDQRQAPVDQGPMSLRDGAPPDASMPDAAGQCNTNTHCGPGCVNCTGSGAPYCSSDGSRCVVCQGTQGCQAGTFCQDEQCLLCDVADHCGPACWTCTGSAEPTCDTNTLKCSCVQATDCGGTSPACTSGVCTKSCTVLSGASDCADAAAGHACIGTVTGTCGCKVQTDCSGGATCTGGVCVCGGTVCKSGQTCQSGVCL